MHREKQKGAIAAALLLATALSTPARTLWVSDVAATRGADGSAEAPFRTIGAALRLAEPGDTCVVRGGVYREELRLPFATNLTLAGAPGEEAILDGTYPVAGPWRAEGSNLFSAAVVTDETWGIALATGPVAQAFFLDAELIPAVWKNRDRPPARWNPAQWSHYARLPARAAPAAFTSGTFRVADRECSVVEIRDTRWAALPAGSLEGAEVLYRSYPQLGMACRVMAHAGDVIRCVLPALPRRGLSIILRNRRELLDYPDEFWFDENERRLYICQAHAPEPGDVAVRARGAGLLLRGAAGITVSNLIFRAAGLIVNSSSAVRVEGCRFLYASAAGLPSNCTMSLDMADGVFAGNEVAFARRGIRIHGPGNRVENNVFHDLNACGEPSNPALVLAGEARDAPAVVRRNTIYNCGAAGLLVDHESEVASNHVFNAGLYAWETGAIQIYKGGHADAAEIHHNWLHDLAGQALRIYADGGDIRIHHNVAWNSQASRLAGTAFEVMHNTLLPGLLVDAAPELAFDPAAAGYRLPPSFRIRNNMLSTLEGTGTAGFQPVLRTNQVVRNDLFGATGLALRVVNAAAMDFRPRPGGPLDDRGAPPPGAAAGKGRPDIGAYDTEGPYWAPGANWLPGGRKPPASFAEATQLARDLLGRAITPTPPPSGSR